MYKKIFIEDWKLTNWSKIILRQCYNWWNWWHQVEVIIEKE
jgi:hypothetical protein